MERKEFTEVILLVRNRNDKFIEEIAQHPKSKLIVGSLKDAHIIQE